MSVITATFTGPRRKTCKQKKPRGPRLRVQRIVITRVALPVPEKILKKRLKRRPVLEYEFVWRLFWSEV